MLIDGLAQFGCSLAAYPDYPVVNDGRTPRSMARAKGIEYPPLDQVVPIEPLVAWVHQGLLVVSCPACAHAEAQEVSLVWRDGPHLTLCPMCGNANVGHAWRPVVLPDNLDEIDAALSCRPMAYRSWRPGQAVDELAAENARFGWVSRAGTQAA